MTLEGVCGGLTQNPCQGVDGPSPTTSGAVALWGDAEGETLTNSVVVIGATGNTSGVGTLNTSGLLTVTRAAEQVRFEFDASNYLSISVGSTGSTTIDLVGTSPILTFGDNIVQSGGIQTNASANNGNWSVPSGAAVSSSTTATFQIGGATTTAYRCVTRGSTSSVLAAGVSYASILLAQQTITEATSGTHPLLCAMAIRPLTIVNGTATATNGATLYIEGPAITTLPANNYSLWVDSGNVQFDGDLTVSGAMAIATGAVTSGTYTPTLTNVANLDASTAYLCQYMRVGSVVTVSGKVDVDPTLTGTSTQLGITLPIASNLANAQNCAGTAFASGIAAQGAAILADTTNDRAQMQWIAGDVSNQAMYFTFTYQII